MKKKIFVLLSLVCAVCALFAFAACSESSHIGNTENGGGTQTGRPGGGTPDDREDYTVTYDANGGTFGQSTLLTQSVKKNATLTAPTSPTRSNFTFSGWATDKSGSEMWNFSDNKVSGDTTLFAVWTQKSATIFSVDGATIDQNNIFMIVPPDTDFVQLSDKVAYSEDSSWRLFYDALGSIEISTKIATGKNGALSNGDNTFFIVVTSQDKTKSNTYALIIHRQYHAQIRYLANDSLYETRSILTGTELTQDYDIPCSVKGYTFHGWDHSENFGDTIWDNVTFTAALTANQYTLYYDPNGAAGSVQEQTVEMGASLKISGDPLFTRQYFILREYNTQPDGEGTSVRLGSSLKFDFGEDTTLYAIWECDYTFTVSAEGVTITGCQHPLKVIDLSENLDGEPIVAISASAFQNNTTVDEIILPDSVTKIGKGAFYGCTALESITLPFIGTERNGEDNDFAILFTSSASDEVTIPQTLHTVKITDAISIGKEAFMECENIRTITLPMGLQEIGDMAFASSGITSINIPESVTKIGGGVFFGCESLADVTLGHITALPAYTVENADNGTDTWGFFENCTALQHISIPNGVGEIGIRAFAYSGLAEINIPESVTTIELAAFVGCSALENVTFDTNSCLSSIGALTFDGCSSLTEIQLPNKLLNIGDAAFVFSGITSINIPESVITIGGGVFIGCESLADVTLGHITALLAYTVENTDNGTDTWGFFDSCTALQHISIPNGVGEIGIRAFAHTGLTEITIPESVTMIDLGAFAGCSALENVTFDTNSRLSSIGESAFYNCSGLTQINIPESVTTIETAAFFGCSALENVTFDTNSRLSSIGAAVFYNCSGLTQITIPESVISIGSNAFWDCDMLQSIVWNAENCLQAGSIADSTVYSIFGGRTNIKTVTFGEKVKMIPSYALGWCSGLISVVIPDSVTWIGPQAFFQCTGLTSVTIGSGVTSIGVGAFYGCNCLQSVTFRDLNGWSCGSVKVDTTVLQNSTAAAEYVMANSGLYWTKETLN